MDLSILIPARNEMFLARTIEDILSNIEGETEVIAVLDGEWADPPIKDDPRVTIIHHSKSIGQRAACNEAARLSQTKYVMKVDAHCAFDKGFDVKMMSLMQDDLTMIPIMRNLHVFDWVCPEGHRRYQSPSGVCKECGKETKREIVWIPKPNPQSTAYYFDKDLHFQYHNDWGRKQTGDLTDTMSAQGSCFMITRKRYFDLNICDESWGSWGNQGTEVALKTWLSGGRLVVNRTTWYGHMFRTQGGDFGFPYPLSGREVEHARQCSRDIFLNDKWEKAVYPLSWLIKKFNPPTWENKELTKGIVYYTCLTHDPKIEQACRKQLLDFKGQIVSVSLNNPIDFGENYVFKGERSSESLFRQILLGLEKSTADIVYLCESDVLYHPSHFDFTPVKRNVYYYNDNKWRVDFKTGQAVFYHCSQVSGLCGYRKFLLEHFKRRIERLEKDGRYDHSIGYEPGARPLPKGIDDFKQELYMSEFPNIDIRHNKTITASRWKTDDFRNKNTCLGWKLMTPNEKIPYWGTGKEILERING